MVMEIDWKEVLLGGHSPDRLQGEDFFPSPESPPRPAVARLVRRRTSEGKAGRCKSSAANKNYSNPVEIDWDEVLRGGHSPDLVQGDDWPRRSIAWLRRPCRTGEARARRCTSFAANDNFEFQDGGDGESSYRFLYEKKKPYSTILSGNKKIRKSKTVTSAISPRGAELQQAATCTPAAPGEIMEDLKKIPGLARPDLSRAHRILSRHVTQFRTLMALPMDMRKDWLLVELGNK